MMKDSQVGELREAMEGLAGEVETSAIRQK